MKRVRWKERERDLLDTKLGTEGERGKERERIRYKMNPVITQTAAEGRHPGSDSHFFMTKKGFL